MGKNKTEEFISQFLEFLGAISLLYMLAAWAGGFDISLRGMMILTIVGLTFNFAMYLLEKGMDWNEIRKLNKKG